MDYNSSKSKLYDFILENKIKVLNQNDQKNNITIKFIVDEKYYIRYDSLLPKLGYSKSKKVNTESNAEKVSQIKLELSYLKEKRDSYVELLKKINEKSDNYLTLWNEQKTIEEKIFNKERELLNQDKKKKILTL